jgi:glycosyltransferase involved in cell wall biosynthesis
MKVSILILTYNEQINIEKCLLSLKWCDDIVVIDSGSTDDTINIVLSHGARVLYRQFDNFAAQRNWGLANAGLKHDWVLHLDADEVVTPEFCAALEDLVPPLEIDAYQVPSKIIFFGRWLQYAGMWPSYQVRLGRRDTLRFLQIGHGQREDLCEKRVGVFPEAYLHFSFSHGLSHWLRRHLKYAEDEVEQLRVSRQVSRAAVNRGGGVTSGRRRLKAIVSRMPLVWRPLMKFSYVYFVRRGFLDGRQGFAYAFMHAVYEGMIAVIGFERLGGIGSDRSHAPSVSRVEVIQSEPKEEHLTGS